MSKNALEILLGSHLRLKILKYVFRNAPASFNIRELAGHVQEKPELVKQEIGRLVNIKLIKLKK